MVTIVDYGLGNLFSVKKAFEAIGEKAEITNNPVQVEKADRIVLPGIGAFGDGITHLRERGLDVALETSVKKRGVPFLGICLGLQLLADTGEEYGDHRGLGWIPGRVRALNVTSAHLKIPHIGWNDVAVREGAALFRGIRANADFYFVHSFQLECDDASHLVGTTQYGETVTAAILKDNMFATQFHPEKSQDNGIRLLENFVGWKP